jgi:neopullulanase
MNLRIHFSLILASVLLAFVCDAQSPQLKRMEPVNWWVGMENPELQILLYGENLGNLEVEIPSEGITLVRMERVENPNYLFLYVHLAPGLMPGNYEILLKQEGEPAITVDFPILKRDPASAKREGFGWADNVYLLMPDRFANGNSENDQHPEMLEASDRSNPDGRHGGDLEGIRKHLGYLRSLGMTALWLNPVFENNQPKYSYHGYAITDLYRIDPRLGTNAEFRALVFEARQYGIKIIMDMVFNHLGDRHWLVQDLPGADWVHQWPEYTRSNFRGSTIPDPYRSQHDHKRMTRGWFDTHMPDLDQTQPLLADYLIQNSIWWVEFAGISGIRMDTHQYADQAFMADWLRRIYAEYPDLGIVGECWVDQKIVHAYWVKGAKNRDGYDSNLQLITDFPLHIAIRESFLDEGTGWDQGVERLYYCIAQDSVYEDPRNNMVFLDNHDLSRFFTICDGDFGRFTTGIAFLYTVRGIPQITYGTEILMTGWEHDGHGPLRADFPGGWQGDPVNAFQSKGRSPEQERAWQLISRLAQWRQGKRVIHEGNTLHFVPENKVYSFFRVLGDERVWVILNYNDESVALDTRRFSEILGTTTTGNEVLSGDSVEWGNNVLMLPARNAMILELP